ncbi:arsenate reductase family protein [Helicobacter sp.]|uniref:arsenate reductase family protein n=1 Tax=Helicobacter sp. TaxID=218 RepID=UPI0025C4341A|nr:Spx/MgsR family RNA polymerase-binding regulatory protein [Helicobacter sp.]MCI5968812.1 Spx/MgsR family RNA polymerase-binding regulatory protein [Helicobacter sp.]MDY2584637.1 Spx/MgsR family RNA polymerase-binding regulatory protein [Helicobacter sp.]
MRLYGIKTCGSVKKAMQFLDAKGVEYTFIDLKKEKPTQEELESWVKQVGFGILLNKKGTTYKKLALKELDLSDAEIKEWLLKEPMLFKRPIVVYDKDSKENVMVGFDRENYQRVWK